MGGLSRSSRHCSFFFRPPAKGRRNHQAVLADEPYRRRTSRAAGQTFLYASPVIHFCSMKSAHSDDINFEPDEELGDVGAAQAKLKKLKDELADVKAQRQEYLDGWQRCKADSVNARKEMVASAQRQGERAKEDLIADIIPALDGFDIAAGSPAWEKMDAGWRSGIGQIQNH